MKNKILAVFTKLCVIAGVCFLFASFSPSLDGRAVVVDDGVFPQGLFAKTVGYLPGDTISVSNIAGDATVDILVIGALDPSEGVAIMLSPEAATAIGIEKNSNNIVKITKRSGQDDRVYGTAVIAKSESVEKKVEEPAPAVESAEEVIKYEPLLEEVEESAPVTEESAVVEETPVIEETPFVEEPVESDVPVETEEESPIGPVPEEVVEEPVSEEVVEENPAPLNENEEGCETIEATPYEEPVEEEVIPEYVEEYTQPQETPVEEAPVSEEIVEEEPAPLEEPAPAPAEEPAIVEETVPAEEETPVEEIPVEETPVEEMPVEEAPIEEAYSEEALTDLDEPVEGEYFTDEKLEDLPAETTEEPAIEEITEEPAAPETGILSEEITTEEFVEETPVVAEVEEPAPEAEVIEEPLEEPLTETAEVLPVAEPVEEEVPAIEEFVEEDELAELPEDTPVEEYEAIVLVPAEANPPVVEEVEPVEVIEEVQPVEEPEEVEVLEPAVEVAVVESVVEEVTVVEEPEVVIEESKPAPAPVEPAPKTTGSLEKYTVSNLKDLKKGAYYIQIAALGDDANIQSIIDKYGKNYPITLVPMANGKTKQILIGPLSMDEYKVVLERFKSYGYKDAFLRKIK